MPRELLLAFVLGGSVRQAAMLAIGALAWVERLAVFFALRCLAYARSIVYTSAAARANIVCHDASIAKQELLATKRRVLRTRG